MAPVYQGALLWDLDGTLLATAKGGRIALSAAIAEHTGKHVDLDDLATSGLTDSESAVAALAAAGIDATDDLLRRVREGYERRLPDALRQREGRVLPGVRDALSDLSSRGRILNLLLTGNTRAGAEAKLARYGLREWFPHGGAFSEGLTGRGPIAQRGLELAASLMADFEPSRVLVVGDTPKDVGAAQGIGVRALGVSTGAYSASSLAAAGAWRTVARVPGAATLERYVLDGRRIQVQPPPPRVAGVVLLRRDGAALLQHRDDIPGLNHAGQWVPPGGHANPGEGIEDCARREFREETGYVCDQLLHLTRFPDRVGATTLDLTMFWGRYDGHQPFTCREGQALEFVPREDFGGRAVPQYLVNVWDAAAAAARASL